MINDMIKVIAVLGSDGMLGSGISSKLQNSPIVKDQKLHLVTEEHFDITSGEGTISLIRGIRPDLIINCAAYTDVDGCESDPSTAFNVNADGVRNLAEAAKYVGARVIHFSTDYIFDGSRCTPYLESDDPNPVNVYGRSKYEGELCLMDGLKDYLIIRTAWLYGGKGRNFVRTILKLARERDEIRVVSDQVGCPTYTMDLADVVLKLVDSETCRIVNVVNKGVCSWYQFAKEILSIKGVKCRVVEAASEEFGRPARRPAYSVLDTGMLELKYHIKMRGWKEALRDYLSEDPDE